jgi:hypothetical protein
VGAWRCAVVSGSIFSLVSVLTGCVSAGGGVERRNTTVGRMGVILLCYDRFIITFLRIHRLLFQKGTVTITHWPNSA